MARKCHLKALACRVASGVEGVGLPNSLSEIEIVDCFPYWPKLSNRALALSLPSLLIGSVF